MIRRPLAGAVAAVLWLTLVILVALVRAIRAPVRRSLPRFLRPLLGRRPRWPRYSRILDALPRRPHPVEHTVQRTRQRMSSSLKARRLAQLVHRDGLWCQECGRRLDLDVHHTADEHPEVHHLVAWSRCRREWWCNDLRNLCLLDGRCNRRVGTGTTWRLRRLAERLWSEAAA